MGLLNDVAAERPGDAGPRRQLRLLDELGEYKLSYSRGVGILDGTPTDIRRSAGMLPSKLGEWLAVSLLVG